ncbi:MAG: tetratricopeptide repeat protein, partial [Dehalococcoidia bacterium]
EVLQRTLDLDPNFVLGRLYLGLAYEQKGLVPDALRELREAFRLAPGDPDVISALGHAHAASGGTEEAQKAMDRLMGIAKRRYVSSYAPALIPAGLGDEEQALACLERACEERSDKLIWLGVDPVLDGLRVHPRFQDLMRAVGLLAD